MTTSRVCPPLRRLLPALAIAATGASLLGACSRAIATRAPAETRVATGTSLLGAMHDRYAGKWYRTLTFRQQTTQPQPNGPDRTTTWHETLLAPGRLRIDTDLGRGNGQLFANDSQYVVVNNTVRRAVAGHNVLLVLGFDVYAQPAARTAAVLRDLGFPDGPVREGAWEGRPTWIVGGAGPNDLHSAQYWIDKERLVFVRLLQPFPGDTTQTYDVRFEQYRPAGAGWLAPRVEAFVGGKRILLEEYEDVRVDPTVSEMLFDPRRWSAAPHWAKGK